MTDHHDAVLKLISSTSAGNLTIFLYLVPGEISLHANCNIFELYLSTLKYKKKLKPFGLTMYEKFIAKC